MTRFLTLLCVQFIAGVALYSSPAFGSEDGADAESAVARAEALNTYKNQVKPFVANYCTGCHGDKMRKGGVTFNYALKSPASPSFRMLWKRAADQIKTRAMPPDDEKQPTE